jgi:hypothetical protein
MQIPHALERNPHSPENVGFDTRSFAGEERWQAVCNEWWVCRSAHADPQRKRSHTMKTIAIILAATVAACQATTASVPGTSRVQTSSAEAAAFAPFRTFGFRLAEQPPSPYELSARSFEVERRVHDLVAAELVGKGYKETGADADLLIRISSGTAREDKPMPITTSGGTENDPHLVTLGEVVVDAFDRGTGQQVWHGTAQAEIDPQRINAPALQATVQRMLTPFPRRAVE